MYKKSPSGQALLLIIMLVATVSVIVATVSFKNISQSRQTKESEEGKKASEGSVAYLEQALNGTKISTITTIDGLDSNQTKVQYVTGFADSSSNALAVDIPKDNIYTFYLADYDVDKNTFSNSMTDILSLYFKPSDNTSQCPVFELTFISGNLNVVTRRITSPCGANQISTNGSTTGILSVSKASFVFKNRTYTKVVQITPPTAGKIMIIRPLFTDASIAFEDTIRPQGRRVTATARTAGGAQQRTSAYQSYPQLPVEIFATTF